MIEKKEFYKNCPFCDLRVESDSEKQFDYNYRAHINKCTRKFKNREKGGKNDKNKS